MTHSIETSTLPSEAESPAPLPSLHLSAFEKEQLESQAIIHLPAIMKRWLPEGRLSGHHWTVIDPISRKHTVRVDLFTGAWGEYPRGASGRSIISLILYLTELEEGEAIAKLKSMVEGCHHA